MSINNSDTVFTASGQLLGTLSAGVPGTVASGTDGQVLTVNASAGLKMQSRDLNTYFTWTPAISGATVPGTATYTTQTGVFCVLGNLAFIWGNISYNTFTGTGVLNISLPVKSGNNSASTPTGAILFDGAFTAGINIVMSVQASSETANILCYGNDVASTAQLCVAAADIQFFIFYTVD